MAEIISKSDAYFIGLFLGSILGATTLIFFGKVTLIGLLFFLFTLAFAVKTFWYDGYDHSESLNQIVVGCRDCGFEHMKMDIEKSVINPQSKYKVRIKCDKCGQSETIRQ